MHSQFQLAIYILSFPQQHKNTHLEFIISAAIVCGVKKHPLKWGSKNHLLYFIACTVEQVHATSGQKS